MAYAVAGLAGIASCYSLRLSPNLSGIALIEPLGPFGFLANFFLQIGETLHLVIPAFAALGAGAAVGGSLGKIGQTISDKSPAGVVKVVNMIWTTLLVQLYLP